MTWNWLNIACISLLNLLLIQQNHAQKRDDTTTLINKTVIVKTPIDSINSFQLQTKIKLPNDTGTQIKKFGKPKFSGRIGFESYATTFQNPRVINEKQYVRTSGSLSVNWLGLPVLLDFYHTTENQNLYNSNYFKVAFDYNKFKDNIVQQWQNSLQESTNNISSSQYKLNQTMKLDKELSGQKDKLLGQQTSLDEKLKTKQAEYESNFRMYVDSLGENVNDSFRKTLHSSQDSAVSPIQSQLKKSKDSLELVRLQKDINRINNKIQDLESKRASIESNRITIDSALAADSVKFNYYKSLIADPEGQITQWLKERNVPVPLVAVSKVEDFRIGIINPWLHTYSLAGLGMKGAQSTVNLNKTKLTVAGGKAIVADISNYNRQNSQYERLLIGSSLNLPLTSFLDVELFGHITKDPTKKFTSENRSAIQSSVLGTHLLLKHKHLPLVDASVATSTSKVLNLPVASISYPGSSTLVTRLHRIASSSYQMTIEQALFNWLKLEGSTQYVGPKFKNLGNPFMRVNFRELQIKSKLQVFKKQLSLSAFYKAIQDNPLKLTEVTNKTSGYGISMNSRFKNIKLPNINASISPYEQGNNHPDSLFRINSHYSIITGGITYQTGRRIKYSNMTFGSQSKMQLSDSLSAQVRTLSISQDLSLGKNFNLGVASTFMRSYPGVDSVQANIHQVRFTLRTGKFSTFNITGFYAQYLNGAYRKGGSMNFSFKINKHFNFSVRSGYDHFYRLWGINNKNAIWGLCRLDWIL